MWGVAVGRGPFNSIGLCFGFCRVNRDWCFCCEWLHGVTEPCPRQGSAAAAPDVIFRWRDGNRRPLTEGDKHSRGFDFSDLHCSITCKPPDWRRQALKKTSTVEDKHSRGSDYEDLHWSVTCNSWLEEDKHSHGSDFEELHCQPKVPFSLLQAAFFRKSSVTASEI